MNNEIKEILQYLENGNWEIGNGDYEKSLYKSDIKMLLDYITNLQQENEDYKSRIDKAVEYIKGWQSFPHTNCTTHNELKNLLNILQNGSDTSVKD